MHFSGMTLYPGQNGMGTFQIVGIAQTMINMAKTTDMKSVDIKNEANKENEVIVSTCFYHNTMVNTFMSNQMLSTSSSYK